MGAAAAEDVDDEDDDDDGEEHGAEADEGPEEIVGPTACPLGDGSGLRRLASASGGSLGEFGEVACAEGAGGACVARGGLLSLACLRRVGGLVGALASTVAGGSGLLRRGCSVPFGLGLRARLWPRLLALLTCGLLALGDFLEEAVVVGIEAEMVAVHRGGELAAAVGAGFVGRVDVLAAGVADAEQVGEAGDVLGVAPELPGGGAADDGVWIDDASPGHVAQDGVGEAGPVGHVGRAQVPRAHVLLSDALVELVEPPGATAALGGIGGHFGSAVGADTNDLRFRQRGLLCAGPISLTSRVRYSSVVGCGSRVLLSW